MSLKIELNNWIEHTGYVTYQQVVDYCAVEHYKTETASRKLRASESPNVEAVFKNGAIIGWKWVGTGNIPKTDEKRLKSKPGASGAVNIGGLDWQSARAVVERQKQNKFLQGK